MSDFQRTQWSDASRAGYFMDHSSRYIPYREQTQALLVSLLCRVIAPRFPGKPLSVLELGCGDGALSQALLLGCPDIRLTLLDGSQEMLEGARKRFGPDPKVLYIQATFQDVIAGSVDLGDPHVVVSAFAIHHLTLAEKGQLFACAARALVSGGVFANVDVVLSPAACLEEWYLELWRDWIREHDRVAAEGKSFVHIPTQYKGSADNLPDTLDEQLRELKQAGLQPVDVFYKCGLFAVYGGFKL
jgi:tRNA (cmo5U34)-methyltransferase